MRGRAQHRAADAVRQPLARRDLHHSRAGAPACRYRRHRRDRAGDVAGRDRRSRGRHRCLGIATCALSSVLGAEELLDCRPIGVGEVIDGLRRRAPAPARRSCPPAIDAEPCRPLEFSIAGICGASPVSSSVIAILKVPSTITTTLAPTSSERILEVMVEGSLSPALPILSTWRFFRRLAWRRPCSGASPPSR